MTAFRTDQHNNPIAFTTDIARQAGLVMNTDYVCGTGFMDSGQLYYTARLLGDPIEICTRVIDKIGFYTNGGAERWIYIGIPKFVWDALDKVAKIRVLQFMYHHEGGKTLEAVFEKALEPQNA
jgi:hypothetical protein